MLTPLQGLKIGRRAFVIGIGLFATTATAVGAASGHAPWPEAARPSFTDQFVPPSTDATTTTVVITTAAPVEPVVEPTTIAVAPSTEAPTTLPPVETTAAPPAPIVTEAPATSAAPEPQPTEPTATEPPAAEPPAAPPVAEPPASHPSDNVVPATLSLSCVLSADSPTGPVACSWSGVTPSGFASFVLLRGDPDGKGRIPHRTGVAGNGGYVDSSMSAGSHSYVLVALDSADHPLAHSNMVLVQIPAA